MKGGRSNNHNEYWPAASIHRCNGTKLAFVNNENASASENYAEKSDKFDRVK